MKADDDTFVSMDGIVKFLEAAPSTRLYAGHFYTGGTVTRSTTVHAIDKCAFRHALNALHTHAAAPVRDPAHKNYVGLECYPVCHHQLVGSCTRIHARH